MEFPVETSVLGQQISRCGRNDTARRFLALLEMVRLQAIQVRQEKLFGEIAVRKHTHFDDIMNEQSAVRDDWR